jgi:hypothetical protein
VVREEEMVNVKEISATFVVYTPILELYTTKSEEFVGDTNISSKKRINQKTLKLRR